MHRPVPHRHRRSLPSAIILACLIVAANAGCGASSVDGPDGRLDPVDAWIEAGIGDEGGDDPGGQRDVTPSDLQPDPFPDSGDDAPAVADTDSVDDAPADPGGGGSDIACVIDTDDDGVPDCDDGCPNDPGKIAPGACGCGVADTDTDGDTVPDCLDRCALGDDLADRDGDGLPDACDACDDDGRTCPWPAETTSKAENLTSAGGPLWNNEFAKDLSGAAWDPDASRLWLCRNNGPDGSLIFAVVQGSNGWVIEERGGERGRWADFGDLESLTLASPGQPFTLYLVTEGNPRIREVDLSNYGSPPVFVRDWALGAFMPTEGPEGLTFVPDALLVRERFVDKDGEPYVSTGGMGGLFLVGHQNGGYVYALDLGRTDDSVHLVGKYRTARTETAGLDFDRDLGLLFLLHGGDFNDVEVARLSSSIVDGERRFDTVHVYEGPPSTLIGGSNYEGIALTPAGDCSEPRSLFLTIDGGKTNSLFRFRDFPCW